MQPLMHFVGLPLVCCGCFCHCCLQSMKYRHLTGRKYAYCRTAFAAAAGAHQPGAGAKMADNSRSRGRAPAYFNHCHTVVLVSQYSIHTQLRNKLQCQIIFKVSDKNLRKILVQSITEPAILFTFLSIDETSLFISKLRCTYN